MVMQVPVLQKRPAFPAVRPLHRDCFDTFAYDKARAVVTRYKALNMVAEGFHG